MLGVVEPSHAAPVETTAGSGHEWTHQFKGHERGPDSWFGMFSVGSRPHGHSGAVGPSDLAEAGTDKPSLPLPVPAAIWMFGTGLAALGLARRRISAWRRRDRRRAMTDSASRPERRKLSRRRLRAVLRERIDCKAAGGQSGEGANASGGGQPDSNGMGGPADVPPRLQCPANSMAQRFAELAGALAEQPDVVPGRRFGMSCVKFGKRPFLALDDGERGGIAFRVGEYGAVRMLAELPQLEYWNPKQERQPKRSWLICHQGYGEVLVRLALEAYEQALRDSTRVADEPREYPAAEPEGA
ncbi:MAG: VPLPA-CTERM sorting domain-containing protein [Rhodocyclales bacterium]|nr:VPLPA-CTERM sorting domain-containing protein [Rhodocyclales bacterium]